MKLCRAISNFFKLIYYFIAFGVTNYGLWLMYQRQILQWLPIVYVISSLVVLGLYERDKLAAKNNMWRTSESTLHFFEWIGGWIGAFWGQLLFRHKTRKLSYQFTFWLIVTFHLLFWSDYVFLNRQGLLMIINYIHGDFAGSLNFWNTPEATKPQGTIEWSR